MENPFQKVWQLITSASHSRTFGLLAILVVIAAIPLTVLVAQRQQETRQRAEGQCSVTRITGFPTNPVEPGTTISGEIDVLSLLEPPFHALDYIAATLDNNDNNSIDLNGRGGIGQYTYSFTAPPASAQNTHTARLWVHRYDLYGVPAGSDANVLCGEQTFTVASPAVTTTPTLTPTLTQTPTPSCTLTSASWSTADPVYQGTNVGLNVAATGNCTNIQVGFHVIRHIAFQTDEVATRQPSPNPVTLTQSGTNYTASTNWTTEWVNSCVIGTCDPEYFFRAYIDGETTTRESNPRLLKVLAGVGGTNPTVNFNSLSPGNNATETTTSVTLSGSITDNLPATQQRKVFLVMSHDNMLHQDPPREILTYTGQTKAVSTTVTLTPGVHFWEFFVQTGPTNSRYHSVWNKFTIVQPNQKYKITGTVKVRSESGIYTPFTGSARVDITGPTNHLNIPVTNGSYTTPEDLNPGLYVITLDDITNYIINPPNPTQLEIWGKTNEDTTADFVITAQTDNNSPITFGDGTPPNNGLTGKRVTFVRIINDTSGSAYGRNVEVLITPQGGTESVLSGSGITYTRMNLTSNAYTYSYPHGQDFEEGKTYSWKVRVTHAGQAYTSSALSFNVNSITESGNITFSQFTPTNRETKNNPVLFKVRINDTNNLTGERSVKFYTNQNLFTPILIKEFKYTKTGAENDQEFPFTKYDLVAGHYWWYVAVDIPSRMKGYTSAWQEFNVTGGTVPSPSTTASPTPSPKPGCPVASHYCSAGSTCQDNRFEPDNRYICGDGQSQTCCILKGKPTPPTCFGCQSVDTWNVCVDDNKKCTIYGQICSNGTCKSTTLPTTPILPTKPVGATPTHAPTATHAPTTTGGATSTTAPTATGGGTGTAKIALTLKLQAIGKNDNPDSQHPTMRENPDPKTPTREIKVEIFNAQNTKVTDGTGNITYDSASGLFKGTVDVSNLTTGDYSVKVKTNKYLRRLIGKELNRAIQHIVAGPTPNQMPQSTLVVGDINNDNNLNIDDYNIYYNCWGTRAGSSTCSDPNKIDLNDDGVIDSRTVLNDYAWLFYSFQVQEGD